MKKNLDDKNYVFWKDVWNKKGNSESADLLYLDGYEHLNYNFSSEQIYKNIVRCMNINQTDSILEVGCGAGFLSREFKNHKYTGVDYVESLLIKNNKRFGTNVFCCEANNLLFSDKKFNKSFMFGVFQYFPSEEYAIQVIHEMKRISSDSIFIGDLKNSSDRDSHLVLGKEWFIDRGFVLSKCFYDENDDNRFNAYLETK